MELSQDRSEIVFFDIETTAPNQSGQGFSILEFGAILVCPRKLVELESYSTLVRPLNLSLISSLSQRRNGITREAVISAPTFAEIANKVRDLLHGRIWAGHNILRFDCARIREAFVEIGQPAPEPKGTIDSLVLLTQKFGRRAGDMKMATLATYFELGQQKHRSLDDVRMNLEVLKYCATVLLLESSLPEIFTDKSWVSPNAITRSRSAGKSSPQGENLSTTIPSSSLKLIDDKLLSSRNRAGKCHLMSTLRSERSKEEVSKLVDSHTTQSDPFDMHALIDELKTESLETEIKTEEKRELEPTETFSTAAASELCIDSTRFLEPDEVDIFSISASFFPLYRGTRRIKLLHKDFALQLCCTHLKVRFGISTKFVDNAGHPRLSIVIDAPPNLRKVLDACDGVAQKLFLETASSSEWRPVVSRKNGLVNSPTVRLNIPTVVCGDIAIYATEIYKQASPNNTAERLIISKFDASELGALFTPGTFVDAFFSLDTFDYQQCAGIRLVAKKLIIHPK